MPRRRGCNLAGGFLGALRPAGLALLAASCAIAPRDPAAGPLAAPTEIRLAQRTRLPVPEAGGDLTVSVGDITRGQVEVTLLDGAGHPFLGPQSMRPGQRAGFRLDGRDCRLELIALENHLVGEDYARLRLLRAEHDARTAVAPEHAAINALLLRIQQARGLVFVRNGRDYSGEQASEFLRRKWERKGDAVRTAEDFIRMVATGSDTSGQPYRVVEADGRETPLADWLRR